MTEAKWLGSTRPKPMLRFLLGTDAPRIADVEVFPNCQASDRKLRLFACACYHNLSHLLADPVARDAISVAEKFSDGEAPLADLQQAHARLWEVLNALEERWRASRGAERTALQPTHAALALALQATRPEAPKAAWYASSNAYLNFAAMVNLEAGPSDAEWSASQRAEERAQSALLRDIFGSLPFRSVALDASLLRCNNGLLVQLAAAIYEERAWERLPVLADALEEAGGTDHDILSHCRGPGPHARGCFVVDLLLNKS